MVARWYAPLEAKCFSIQYDIFILFWQKSAIWCQLLAICDTPT